MDKALKELNISEPYFLLLSHPKLSKSLRKSLIKEAPEEFYSVLTQAVRHLINGSFCVSDPNFCARYQNSLYLIALPTTTLKDRQKVLITENSDFIKFIYTDFIKLLYKNDS